MKYICESKDKERRLGYFKKIGKGRIYRFYHKNDTSKFSPLLFIFPTLEKAQAFCDRVNTAYNDNFQPLEID